MAGDKADDDGTSMVHPSIADHTGMALPTLVSSCHDLIHTSHR